MIPLPSVQSRRVRPPEAVSPIGLCPPQPEPPSPPLKEIYAPVTPHSVSTASVIVALIMVGTLGIVVLVHLLTGKLVMHTEELGQQVQEEFRIIERFYDHVARSERSRGIASEIRRLERTLDGPIDFSRRSDLNRERVDPNHTIQRFLRVCSGKLKDKTLKVETRLGNAVRNLLLDPTRFEQVARNLVSNAKIVSPPSAMIVSARAFRFPAKKPVNSEH